MPEFIVLSLIVLVVAFSIVIEEPIKSYLLDKGKRALAYLGFGWEIEDYRNLAHFDSLYHMHGDDSYDRWNLFAAVWVKNRLTGEEKHFRSASLVTGDIKVYDRLKLPFHYALYAIDRSRVYRREEYMKRTLLYQPLVGWSGVLWEDVIRVPNLYLDYLFFKARRAGKVW